MATGPNPPYCPGSSYRPGEVDLTPDAGHHDWPSVWGGGLDGGRDACRAASYRPARIADHRRGRAPAPASSGGGRGLGRGCPLPALPAPVPPWLPRPHAPDPTP